MPDTRVGSLDNPERYGRRSMAIYQNNTGFYYKLDGCREKVHGNQLWTTSMGNLKMRGSAPVDAAPVSAADWDGSHWDGDGWDEDHLAAAIAASLEEDVPMAVYDPPDAAAAEIPPFVVDEPPSSSGGRTCVVCLTDGAAVMMRPCNHVCACQGCARRLVRHPCPICRRMVTKTERVYF